MAGASVALLVLPLFAACAVTQPPAVLPARLHINFQPATGAKPPAGYKIDSGAAFNGTLGWQTLNGLPLDLRSNARVRNSAVSPDVRWDTLQQMQATPGSGITTQGRWIAALRNGTYNVTVTVGDASPTRSAMRINAQSGTPNAVTIINRFVPTSTTHWQTATRRVTVTGNQLILDPIGGSNTKINFVDAQPLGASVAVNAAHGPYDDVYKLPKARLVFSTVYRGPAAAPQQVILINRGKAPLTLSRFSLGGPWANQYRFTTPPPASLTIAPGSRRTLSVSFLPTPPANCATSATRDRIANSNRAASLTYLTNDSTAPQTSVDLAGLISCGNEGVNEPVLDQIMTAVGYSTLVVPANAAGSQRRMLGAAGPTGRTDEISSPYFRVANPALPVRMTPVARYTGKNTVAGGSGRAGWYLKGANVTTPCSSTVCRQQFLFAPDTSSTYVQNQKLMPVQTGSTSFTPTGAFGIYAGDGREISFSDDSLNNARTAGGDVVTPERLLHNMRVYPAYGPNRVRLANTWVIAIDTSRVAANKNNDFQDDVLVLYNAVPL